MIDKLNNYYTKERKYNKITNPSRMKGGKTNAGTTVYANEYRGKTWQQRINTAALKASDNGRCWWIHDYIIRTSLAKKS